MSLLLLFRSPSGGIAVTGAHRASTTQLFAGTVTLQGAANVIGAHISSTLQMFPGAAPAPSYSMVIGGVPIEPLYGWEVIAALNAQTSFRCEVLSVSGTYRPAIDQEIYLYEGTALLFGGIITEAAERGMLGEPGTPIIIAVTAHDFKTLAQRRHDVNETIPAGTLKAALQQLIPYMPDATLDTLQENGPALNELIFEDATLESVLNNLSVLSGYTWDFSFDKKLRMRAPVATPSPHNITPLNDITEGDVTVEPSRNGYSNRIVARSKNLRSVANNGVEQGDNGIWSKVIQAADAVDQIGLDALAAAYLTKSVQVSKKVRYVTTVVGMVPGQIQTINVPHRGVASATYLITEIRTRRFDGITRRHVTAVLGTTNPSDWRNVYRQWSGGGSEVAAGVTGAGGAVQKPVYFLGGNGIEATRSPTATWVPASGGSQTLGQGSIHVQIDTALRGTVAATIVARLRALNAGVTVQARLYDVSIDAAVPGVSPPVTSTTWQTVSWNVTLNAGAHVYELQLLPDTQNSDVMGTAYIE